LLIIILIIAFSAFLLRLIGKIARQWAARFEDLPPLHPRRQRALTIGNLFTSTARYIIWPLAFITILTEFDVNVGALIATAGVAGFAIGFGAQTLVRDVISGIFLLFDDTIHVGDLVRIGTDEGVVEYIGIRLLKVRKFNGELMMVPAGELRIFGNRSIDYARVIVEVGLSYEQDVDAILPVMEQVAQAWAEEHSGILLGEEPQIQALTQLGDSAVMARIVAKVVPGEQFEGERQLRKLLKRTFDEWGIEIPFPRRTIYMRQETAPPPRAAQPPPDA
jgi:small conductance mechanosensitive channel